MESSNTELILIRITGEDRPGLTSSIMGILARYDVTVLDIGQADIHNTLTLGLLVRAAEEYSGHVMRDLLFKTSELGVNIRFYPVKKDEYVDWVNMQGKNRYILTLLGRKLSALQIQAVRTLMHPADGKINLRMPCRTQPVILRHVSEQENSRHLLFTKILLTELFSCLRFDCLLFALHGFKRLLLF